MRRADTLVYMARIASFTLLATALLCLTGCPPQQDKRQNHLRLIADAQANYDKKLYSRTIEIAGDVLSDSPEPAEAAQALYLRSLGNAFSQKRPAAYADAKAAAAKAPDGDTRWRATAFLGTLFFEDEDWGGAAQAYGEAIDAGAPNPPLDFLLFRCGQSLERSGRWADAQPMFNRIVYTLPRGNYSDASLRRLQSRPSNFAIQCAVIFGDRKNAEKMVVDLKAKGFAAYFIPERRADKPANIVLVGRYSTYREAQKELSRVRGYVADAVIWP